MSQVDNFLKLYWNMQYEDKMSVKKASEIVLNILIISVATIGESFFDDEFGTEVSVPICNLLRQNLHLLSACQHLLVFGVSSFATTYVVKTFLRL